MFRECVAKTIYKDASGLGKQFSEKMEIKPEQNRVLRTQQPRSILCHRLVALPGYSAIPDSPDWTQRYDT